MSSNQRPAVGRAVCFSLPPFATESARGYIARVADYNMHERHVDALSDADVDLNDVMAGRVDAGLLDAIYGLEPAGTSALWPQVLEREGPVSVVIHGVELPRRLLNHRRRRVSVAGLRKSLHHRHAWAIEALGFCPESWDVLVENCPDCGHRLAWGNGALWCCDACGIDLRRCRSARIRQEHRPALAVLSDLFSPEVSTRQAACRKFPAFFHDVSLRTKINFIRTLGNIFDRYGPSQRNRPNLPPRYPMAMWVGLDVLLRLDDHKVMLDAPTGEARAWQSDLRARLRPFNNQGNELGKLVREILAILLPRYTAGVEAWGVRVGRAATQLRIGAAKVRQLVDLGLLPTCSTGGGRMRQHDFLASNTIDDVHAQLSDRISLRRLAASTGVTGNLLMAMAQAGHLQTVDNELTRLLFTETQFHVSASEKLTRLKSQLLRRDSDDPECIRLSDLFCALGIGFKPWIPLILEAAEAGQLGAFDPSVVRKATLNVSMAWVRRFARGEKAWASQQDIAEESISLVNAEDYLNTLPRDTSCLIAHGQLQRGERGVSAQSVRRCALRFVSTREIAARAGIEADLVAGLAARLGVARSYQSAGVWPRAHIEAALNLPPPGCATILSRAVSPPQC